jgi:hypothetical protein
MDVDSYVLNQRLSGILVSQPAGQGITSDLPGLD